MLRIRRSEPDGDARRPRRGHLGASALTKLVELQIGVLFRAGVDMGGDEVTELSTSDGDVARLKAGQPVY